MREISKPVIHEIDYTVDGLKKFSESAVNFKKKTGNI